MKEERKKKYKEGDTKCCDSLQKWQKWLAFFCETLQIPLPDFPLPCTVDTRSTEWLEEEEEDGGGEGRE